MVIGVASANRAWTRPNVVLIVYFIGHIYPLLISYLHLPAMVSEDNKMDAHELSVSRTNNWIIKSVLIVNQVVYLILIQTHHTPRLTNRGSGK